jgi:hypothetical protein
MAAFGLYLLAIGTWITVAQRVVHVWRQAKASDAGNHS